MTIDNLINNEKARKGRIESGNNNNNNNNNNAPTIATAEAGRKRIMADADRALASLKDALATIATMIVFFEGDQSAINDTINALTLAIDAAESIAVPSDWAAPAVRIGARARLSDNAPIRSMLPKADGLWTITAINGDAITLSDRIIVRSADIVPVK